MTTEGGEQLQSKAEVKERGKRKKKEEEERRKKKKEQKKKRGEKERKSIKQAKHKNLQIKGTPVPQVIKDVKRSISEKPELWGKGTRVKVAKIQIIFHKKERKKTNKQTTTKSVCCCTWILGEFFLPSSNWGGGIKI